MSSTKLSMDGLVALVTGAGTGIGLMIAEGFADNGAKVYITGRRSEPLEKASQAYKGPGSLVALPLDVTNAESIAQGVKVISEADGKLNVLVNNAGIASWFQTDLELQTRRATMAIEKTPFFHLETPEGFESVLKTNLIAPYFVSIAFQDLLTKGATSDGNETSSIINISSLASQVKNILPSTSYAYPLSKAGLDLLTTQLASGFARYNIPIRVNTLSPGLFQTDILSQEDWDALRDKPPPGFVAPIPLKRFGTKKEMASTAIYLATNGYVNGTLIVVGGGVDLVNV